MAGPYSPNRAGYIPINSSPFSQKTTSKCLAKLYKILQTFFSQNSNVGIRGSSAKATPPKKIHLGYLRLFGLD